MLKSWVRPGNPGNETKQILVRDKPLSIRTTAGQIRQREVTYARGRLDAKKKQLRSKTLLSLEPPTILYNKYLEGEPKPAEEFDGLRRTN